MTRKPFTTALLVYAAMTVRGGETVRADATLSYPGIRCVEDSDTTPEIFYATAGAAKNGNTTTVQGFRCPLQLSEPDGSTISSIFVEVENVGTTTLSCYAHSCDWDGLTCSNGSTATCSSTAGFCTLNLGNVTGYDKGFAYIYCDVPKVASGAYSGVYTYRWLNEI